MKQQELRAITYQKELEYDQFEEEMSLEERCQELKKLRTLEFLLSSKLKTMDKTLLKVSIGEN